MFKESWESRNIPRETGRTAGPFRRISWGAVFAGVVVALVVQMVLSLLGLGIGMGTINPVEETNPLAGLGIGTLIWWIVTMLISLFIGGWVAGRLAGMPRTQDSLLHGVLTWSVFTLLSFYLVTTTVGGILNTAGNIVSKAVSVVGQGASAVAPEAKEKISDMVQQTGVTAEELKDPEIRTAFDNLFREDGSVNEANKGQVINLVAEKTNKSRQESTALVNNWIDRYQEARVKFEQTKADAKEKAIQTADDVSSAVSKAGIFGSIGLILGGIVTALGGVVGRPKDEVVVPVEEPVYKR